MQAIAWVREERKRLGALNAKDMCGGRLVHTDGVLFHAFVTCCDGVFNVHFMSCWCHCWEEEFLNKMRQSRAAVQDINEWSEFSCELSCFAHLETRAKESNAYANIWVDKTQMWNESNFYSVWRIPFSLGKGILQNHLLSCFKFYLIVECKMGSIFARTRKTAIYAWTAWKLVKANWRSELMMTCKSLNKFVYSGERLIELSSSWFRPKFLSG